jgi:hypothetical protein
LGGQPFDYPQASREIQRGREAYAGANPWANGLLNLAGGVAMAGPSVGARAAAEAPSLLGQVWRGALTGTGMGAVQGAADQSSSVGDALLGAVHGIAPSIGGIPIPIAPGIGAAVPLLMAAAPAVRDFARRVWNPAAQAVPNAVRNIQQQAETGVAAGGPSIEEMGQELAANPNSPLSILDVGSRPVQRYGGSLYRSDTPASTIIPRNLDARDAGSGDRLLDLIDQHIDPRRNTVDVIHQLGVDKATAAAPLYERAFNQGRPIYSDRLQQFIDHPDLQEGLRRGIRIQQREALARDVPFDPNDYAVNFNAAGDPVYFGTPNMRTLDAAKRGLDDMVEAYRDPVTGRLNLNGEGRSLNELRGAYVQHLDSLNPDYAAARAAWAGPSQAQASVERGRTLMNRTPDEVGDVVSRMSPTDLEFARIGVADKLRRDVTSRGYQGDEALGVTKNAYAEQRLRHFFDSDDQFREFMNTVENERRMFATRQTTMGNSATAERGAADSANAGSTMGDLAWPMLVAATSANPLTAMASLGAGAVARPLLQRGMDRVAGRTPEAMSAAAQMLTTTDPIARQRVIDLLMPLPRQPSRSYLAPLSGLLGAARAAAPSGGLLGP